MEGLFNSPFMIKLQEFGQKLGSNKFLGALQGAMMSLMGVIMVGAIAQIITSVCSETMLGLFTTGSEIYNLIYLPYQFGMNFLAVWIVVLLSFFYARNLKLKSPVMCSVDATVAFFIVAGTLGVNEAGASVVNMTYLGAQGMFVGFIVSFIVVQIEKVCVEKKIYIRMPEVVPQFLQDGFAGIVPLLLSAVLFIVITAIISNATGGAYNLASGIMALLSAPLNALTSVPGMFVLCIFAAVLWCFGIHGTMILVPIIMPLGIQAAVANAAAHAAGEALTFYPVALFGAMAVCGGTGNTLPLAIFGLRAKSEQIKAVAKISVIPGWFGINEPMTFGMPIMYNPILCIPYVLNIPVVMLCTYFAYSTGLLMPGWISISALLPMGFARYLSTLQPFSFVWDYICLIPAGLVWYPFFRAYDKQLAAKEAEQKALEAAQA